MFRLYSADELHRLLVDRLIDFMIRKFKIIVGVQSLHDMITVLISHTTFFYVFI